MPKTPGGGGSLSMNCSPTGWAAVCQTGRMQASVPCGLDDDIWSTLGTTRWDAVNKNVPRQCASCSQVNHFSSLVTGTPRMNTRPQVCSWNSGRLWGSRAESVNTFGEHQDLTKNLTTNPPKQKLAETPWRDCSPCCHADMSLKGGTTAFKSSSATRESAPLEFASSSQNGIIM